jgi:HD domain
MLTDRLGLPPTLRELFVQFTERWDGKGEPGRLRGEEIPLPLRIVHVARDAAFQCLLGGEDYAVEVIRERAGHAFDPSIASLVADEAHELLAPDANGSAWEGTLAREPATQLVLQGQLNADSVAAVLEAAGHAAPRVTDRRA